MNWIVIINIISFFVFFISILISIFLMITKKLFVHSGFFLVISFSIILFVVGSNVLEYAKISILYDELEEYAEILVIPYFLLFIYSISSFNEINKREKNEQRLSYSLQEREVLLKEIHHRVKNNLQIVTSLLSMQKEQVKDKQIEKYLNDAMNRVLAMGNLHEALYRSNDFLNVDLNNYLERIINHLKLTYYYGEDIDVVFNCDEIKIDIDVAIPCGLIVNEIVSNSYKFAFTEQTERKIGIDIKKMKTNGFVMELYDTGSGFSKEEQENKNGLGLQLVHLLAKQVNGHIDADLLNGTKYTITINR